jgi:hypothetical protein
MTRPGLRWVPHAVLLAGMALRVGLAVVMPADYAYDDHLAPILKIAHEGRLPRAEECWECYQPPAYYLVSAGVFRATEGAMLAAGASADVAGWRGHKAIQFVSVVAGCTTLLVCRAVLRRVYQLTPVAEGLALAIPALLPQHIYMSAMVTNDALTYCVASLAIWATLRAHAGDWSTRWCVAAGALAGATVLCKAYGLVTVAVVAALAVVMGMARVLWMAQTARGTRGRGAAPSAWAALRPAVLVPALALTVGVWPSVRNQALYQRLHVDNFQFFRTGMHSQPPGTTAGVSFTSLRFLRLLEFPWIHVAHLDSFWTEMYARFWFDYEGMTLTLRSDRAWMERRARIQQQHGGWSLATWKAILNWVPDDVPTDFARVARIAYVGGLPLTLLVLAGVALALRRFLGNFALALLLLHLAGCLCVPLFQVLRLPYFAAMKAAFALSGLSSVPVLAAGAHAALRGRWQTAATLVAWLAVAAVALANVGYIAAFKAHLAPAG